MDGTVFRRIGRSRVHPGSGVELFDFATGMFSRGDFQGHLLQQPSWLRAAERGKQRTMHLAWLSKTLRSIC